MDFSSAGIVPVIAAATVVALIYEASPVVGAWLVIILVLGALITASKRTNPQIQSV